MRYGKILIFEHHIICKFYYFESFSNIKFFLIKEEFCLRLPCLRKENHKDVCNAGNGVITHFPKNLKITTPRKPGKIKPFQSLLKKLKKISTHLLARLGWFCPVVSEPVKPYFTRFLRVLTFCLRASKIVIF